MIVMKLRIIVISGFVVLGLLNLVFFVGHLKKSAPDLKSVPKKGSRIAELNQIRTLAALRNGHHTLDPKNNVKFVMTPDYSCLNDCGAFDVQQMNREVCEKCSVCGPVCWNKKSHEVCEQWAKNGECDKNPQFMLQNCAASCESCGALRVTQQQQLSYFVELSNGLWMPSIGFGTAALGDYTLQVVTNALSLGYQLLDTAEAKEWYRQDLVGQAVKNAGVLRDEIFITSKLHPRDFGFDSTLKKIQSTLEELQVDYLDQFLLHYAHCFSGLIGCEKNLHLNQQEKRNLFLETWQALEKSYNDGKILSIGVSNFDKSEIEYLNDFAEIKPMVLQRNSDPFSQDVVIRKYCLYNNIQYVAYSSLGTQHQMRDKSGTNPVLNNKILQDLGKKIGNKGVVQVILRWGLQEGQVVIPRSRNFKHMKENLKVLEEFYLTEEYLNQIDCLDGRKE